MKSKIVKNQRFIFGPKVFHEGGETFKITAKVRYDDECGNGHNTFSITGLIDRKTKNGKWVEDCGGCIHNEIAKHFPELAKYIKWHLVSSDGPMYYMENTLFHAKEGKFDYARSTAIWPEATEADLVDVEKLKARLPALMVEFRSAMREIGFSMKSIGGVNA